jgi:hypothetical protein
MEEITDGAESWIAAVTMMTDVGRHEARKARERALLSACLGQPSVDASDPTPSEAIQWKAAWRLQYQEAFVREHAHLTETFTGHRDESAIADQFSDYKYQRFDLRFLATSYLSTLYTDMELATEQSLGLLTSGGMAAVTATLYALSSMQPGKMTLRVAPDAFFETHSFLRLFAANVMVDDGSVAGSKPHVLFLDSIGREPHSAMLFDAVRPPDAVVFDTTAYDRRDARIVAVVAHCYEHRIPTFLVRSHTKLDTFGIELGRLGSIVGIDGEAVMRSASNHVALTGQNFDPRNVLPIMNSPEAKKLSTQRVASLRQAGRASALAARRRLGRRVKSFHHGLFFVVDLDSDDPSDELATDLARRLDQSECPVRAAGSFGLDFFAIDQMRERGAPRPALRVAAGDVPRSAATRFGERLADEILRSP